MNAELFYLVGKPNSLKQSLVSHLKTRLENEKSLFVPEVFTSDESLADSENYTFVDERDFLLRRSMGMYCLDWKKKSTYFGVGGDLLQRLNAGLDIILNGSLHNLESASKQFPNLNLIMIKKQGVIGRESESQYLIAEDDEVKLEWSNVDSKIGHPYILTLMSEDSMGKAVDMLLNLITYERSGLDKVV